MPNFTKEAIKQSFIRLLNDRPLAKITVRDIVEDCGINRNSFYYHFTDIPSLLEELVTEQAAEIIAEYPTIDSIETCLLAAVRFARENKRAIQHIYSSMSRPVYDHYLWQVCEAVVTKYIDTLLADNPIDENDRRLCIRLYKGICFGVASEWIYSGMHSDIEADLHRICELKSGMAEEMLRRCRKQNPSA